MKYFRQFNLVFISFLVLTINDLYGQQNDKANKVNMKDEPCEKIYLYSEPVEGVYKNYWYAYKLDNGDLAIMSEGKTKEIKAFINFNCKNDKYIIYTSSNFSSNISENEFKKLVPNIVIDLSRKIDCQ